MKRRLTTMLAFVCALGLSAEALTHAADKPNILVIMSDDVGVTNISAYSRGLVGYQTPNTNSCKGFKK